MTDITRMLSLPTEEELFELCGFCRELADRCNKMLSGTRSIKLRSSGKIFVRMDGLNAAVALTHLIQNALKYSPEDSVPIINVFTEPNKGDPIAVIRISNIASRQLSAVDLNARQLMGTGLRIIKRFAEMEGGGFELIIQEDIISAEMTLPAVPLQKAAGKKTGNLSDILSDNGTGMPDVAETLMFEITDGERF